MTISADRADITTNIAPLMVAIGNTSLHVTPEQFDILCIHNPDLRLGVKLGLLINPQGKTVEIYPAGTEVQVLESAMSIDCSSVMPNFILNLNKIW